MSATPTPGDGRLDSLLARARAAVEEKTDRGVYTAEFRALLDEPLDIRPDPAFAAGPAWGEALRTADIDPEPPIVSTRPVIGPLVRGLKGAVRRGLRWYLPPVTAQVTAHNRAVVDVLAEHSREIVRLRREVEALRRRVVAVEAQAERDAARRA
ncbi:MAG TPA: hypothetical protein VGQ42_01355 [Candidatus Dormibacteraeota bacterium]|jgi:hypothetical protein|nr:hypothetical protein [Candidatus Dormibacteraeota bacterium]